MQKNNSPLESEITKQVANYLRWLKVPFIHIPNEAKRTPQAAMLLKAMGMSPGFPDMFIYRQSRGYAGMALELKRAKGGRLSDAQREWLQTLTDEGYYAVCARGYKVAKAEIDWYLGRKEDGRTKDDE